MTLKLPIQSSLQNTSSGSNHFHEKLCNHKQVVLKLMLRSKRIPSCLLRQLGSQWHLSSMPVLGSAEALQAAWDIDGRLHRTLGVRSTGILPLILHPEETVRQIILYKLGT